MRSTATDEAMAKDVPAAKHFPFGFFNGTGEIATTLIEGELLAIDRKGIATDWANLEPCP